MDKRYEYRIVSREGSAVKAVEEINRLATEGFRIISCAGTGSGMGSLWVWTLEREIPSATPYRG